MAKDRPIAEAEVQCQRTSSAIVSYTADSNDEAEGKPRSGLFTTLPQVDVDKDTSNPDLESICFTVAIAPDACFMFVNWRELWSNGAVYWHTSILDHYSLQYGLDATIEKFQPHISNIVDWGLGERATKIYEQARPMTKRKTGRDDDMPVIKDY